MKGKNSYAKHNYSRFPQGKNGYSHISGGKFYYIAIFLWDILLWKDHSHFSGEVGTTPFSCGIFYYGKIIVIFPGKWGLLGGGGGGGGGGELF